MMSSIASTVHSRRDVKDIKAANALAARNPPPPPPAAAAPGPDRRASNDVEIAAADQELAYVNVK